MLFTPSAYPNVHTASFTVPSPEKPSRHLVPTSQHHRDTSPLPGLSSMLQQQRHYQDTLLLSPYTSSWQHHEHGTIHKSPIATTSDSIKPKTSITTTGIVKSSRYLREMDRRVILSRIEQGEKQSALAKEYQVSRAAICNLNKHRDEVLSRKDGNPLAKHPKKPRLKTGGRKSGKHEWQEHQEDVKDQHLGVYAVESRAVVLLLTSLRKKQATVNEFRRSSDRLIRIVLEEALAFVPVKAVEIFLPNHSKSDGVALEHPPCAISMESAGSPMLELFHLIEPDQPTGYMTFTDMTLQSMETQLCGHRLPTSLNYHNVFLLDHVLTSPHLVMNVVRRLQEHGAVVPMITFVALLATREAVTTLHGMFPMLNIVVAQVEDGRTMATDMILDRMEQVYHNSATSTVLY
ncbi:Predicted uracil phosphoribosyltransferase [Plasmopara halstedii]|uniref:Predicted uracil phosphoribosyltransferase n=1 Tax=Plasmopara halstedii TaxID=4781 RepID=A0A0P1A7S8_PLAHL|nr:Predicted uracil phosphoribosyltransferase [Plasmopara halstedii]CEG36255.1 Predicted uracil phosphoribosyltransferase [Plasmopara halstedii]|eukprot:XP_024572624.1 Predicted uracil phosphoribosyltransferase [Plasmopara halstedii]